MTLQAESCRRKERSSQSHRDEAPRQRKLWVKPPIVW